MVAVVLRRELAALLDGVAERRWLPLERAVRLRLHPRNVCLVADVARDVALVRRSDLVRRVVRHLARKCGLAKEDRGCVTARTVERLIRYIARERDCE